ncbi:hypothetical protein C7434_3737 [Pantoea sp. PNA 14-12]|uniref:hypothetical protein n=1 Tax=Pantoea TaxID=53335 RepID=UPI000496E58C|nr:hypothetical protein [Pantoea]MCS3401429.1 hypothetical protein [Pantoea sp. B566]PVY84062.1 hypothetical protein C7427_105276 [Pantoea ananatis]TDS67992.1 hypothetical protein C7434_3737 [Pantoea sp. PNA 14-12]
MLNLKKFIKAASEPDRIMDLFVKNRWDTRENPAGGETSERYYFDRSGALRINLNNKDVQSAIAHNVRVLAEKK